MADHRALAAKYADNAQRDLERPDYWLALAQVHATLAVADALAQSVLTTT